MDYEKEYKEALERAKAGKPMDEVFPELKESEDERIRKAIESIIRVYGKTQGEWIAGYDMDTLVVHLRDAFAFLEKQKDVLGERAKNITANMLEDGIGGIQRELIEFLSNTVNASWVDVIKSADAYAERIRNIIEKQKEQKEQKEQNGSLRVIKDASEWEKIKEQKPVEWSEEDEANFAWFDKFFRAESIVVGGRDIPQDKYIWFKSLRPQPKPEWREEDEKTINDAIRLIERYAIDGHKKALREDVIGRLKSLLPQPHWKPSEEQMKALGIAIRCGIQLGTWEEDALRSLNDELKSL